MAPVVEPPPAPRRAVADRAGPLQGQLRALSARLLLRQTPAPSAAAPGGRHHRQRRGATDADDDDHAATTAAVSRMQRRAFEVLLRLDKDVSIAELASPAERHESNALKLGGALLSLRVRGDNAAADLLEGLADAFVVRRTVFLPATPYTDVGPLPQLPDYDAVLADAEAGVKTRHGFEYDAPPHAPYREDATVYLRDHAATLSILLALAGTGPGGGGGQGGRGDRGGGGASVTDDAAIEGSAFRHLSMAITSTASSSLLSLSSDAKATAAAAALEGDVDRAVMMEDAIAAANSAYDTMAARRAARASTWLQLTPTSVLEAPPSFRGAFTATTAVSANALAHLAAPAAVFSVSSSSVFASAQGGLPAARSGPAVLPSFTSLNTASTTSSVFSSAASGNQLQTFDGVPHAGALVPTLAAARRHALTGASRPLLRDRDPASSSAAASEAAGGEAARLPLGALPPPGSLTAANECLDGSLFGALVRTKLPPPSARQRARGGDASPTSASGDDDALGVQLTIPPWGEGGLFDSWGGARAGGRWGHDEDDDDNDAADRGGGEAGDAEHGDRHDAPL